MPPKQKDGTKKPKSRNPQAQRVLDWDSVGNAVEQADFKEWCRKALKKSPEDKKKKSLELAVEIAKLEEKLESVHSDKTVETEAKLKKLMLQQEFLDGFVVLTPSRSRAPADPGSSDDPLPSERRYGSAIGDESQVDDDLPLRPSTEPRKPSSKKQSSICSVS